MRHYFITFLITIPVFLFAQDKRSLQYKLQYPIEKVLFMKHNHFCSSVSHISLSLKNKTVESIEIITTDSLLSKLGNELLSEFKKNNYFKNTKENKILILLTVLSPLDQYKLNIESDSHYFSEFLYKQPSFSSSDKVIVRRITLKISESHR